jgi:hypothetical protein
MKSQGFEGSLADVIRRGFEGRATLDFASTAKLLNMNLKSLRCHVRSGNIGFRLTGLGRLRVRREFALEDVLAFYESTPNRSSGPAASKEAIFWKAGRSGRRRGGREGPRSPLRYGWRERCP